MSNTSDNTWDIRSLTKMAICLAMMCVSAYIAFPLPFASTMVSATTIVLNLTAFILTAKQTFITVLLYIIIGAVGLPVFVGGSCGFGEIFGPNGGFFLGFLIAYPLISIFKGKEPSFRRYWIVAVSIGIPIIYAGAIMSVMLFLKMTIIKAFLITALPFIPGDIVKAIIAAWIGIRINRITQK